MTDTPPADVSNCSKLVWATLRDLGEATAQEIAEASAVKRRMVNYCLRELREAGHVAKQERPISHTYRLTRK